MKINKLKQLQDLGQSIWPDSFDREMLDSGNLKTMMDEDGISGITSNPSIFEKASKNWNTKALKNSMRHMIK